MPYAEEMDIGQKIRRAREAKKWTQRQLAARMGVNNSAVAQWELGTTLPTISNRADLSKVLGIPFLELVPEISAVGAEMLKDPLVMAIIQQVIKLPTPVQEALLVQLTATAEALGISESQPTHTPG